MIYIILFGWFIDIEVDSVENGTCATIWPLWNTSREDLNLKNFEACATNAPPLTIDDILLNSNETKFFNRSLTHCLLRIIITHGGEKFEKFQEDLERTQPVTEHKIHLHMTPLHPLPAMNIDESTIIGNDEVVTAIHEELKITKDDHEQGIKIFCGDHANTVKVFGGDQLSLARLRALASIRAGREKGVSGYHWGFKYWPVRNLDVP